MARPGRVELPTLCLEGRRSIQLSYGRPAVTSIRQKRRLNGQHLSFVPEAIQSVCLHKRACRCIYEIDGFLSVRSGATLNRSRIARRPVIEIE